MVLSLGIGAFAPGDVPEADERRRALASFMVAYDWLRTVPRAVTLSGFERKAKNWRGGGESAGASSRCAASDRKRGGLTPSSMTRSRVPLSVLEEEGAQHQQAHSELRVREREERKSSLGGQGDDERRGDADERRVGDPLIGLVAVANGLHSEKTARSQRHESGGRRRGCERRTMDRSWMKAETQGQQTFAFRGKGASHAP